MSYEVSGWQEPTLGENLARAGVKRRDFLKFCGGLAGVLAAGSQLNGGAAFAAPTAEQVATVLEGLEKPILVWLQLQECTGCIESALRSGGTTVEDIVLNLLSVNYVEAIMAPSGDAANAVLEDANRDAHILVVNGSVPRGLNGAYCTIGGESAETVLKKSAENAVAVLAVGACAVWGGVQSSRAPGAGKHGPTDSVGVDTIIKDKTVINIGGCPPVGEVITATCAYLLTHDLKTPELDAEGRPRFAYDQRIHDSCPRRAHFDAGQFVKTFDDTAARNGWCLYEVGCKGPSTFSACPIIQWNMHTSWPIGAGHPCIGCTEKNFFDEFTPFYSTLPDVRGFGIEASAETVGLVVAGVAAAGVAAHAGVTAVRHAASRKAAQEAPLDAFGDSKVWLPDPTVKDAPETVEPEGTTSPDTDTDPAGKAE
ncbi:MAG: hydrogenase small subunit [Micrococcales bacterium]|nr:hydrogenase small subunit [Micrococcales bacterium]